MFTKDQTKALFLRVMDRIVEARWLHSHTFTDGKGHHLTWTEDGTQRSILLKQVVTAFRLSSDDRAALAFDLIVHGEILPDWVPPFELDADVSTFWKECVAQLGLKGDEDGLLALVQIIKGWTPDSKTPVKIGR